MNDIVLVVGSRRVTVKRSWIPRWEALSNVVEAMNATELQWTLSSQSEVALWVALNEGMDARYPMTVIPFSIIRRIIDAMLPSSDEWMLYVVIDNYFPLEDKRDWYERTGRFIRSNRIPFPYNSQAPGLGVHFNLYLYLDLAYGAPAANIEAEDYPPQLLEAIINSPSYNLATGVLHVGWLESNPSPASDFDEDDEPVEVRWDIVRWSELVDVHLIRPEDLRTYQYSIYSARKNKTAMLALIGVFEGPDSPYYSKIEEYDLDYSPYDTDLFNIRFLAGVEENDATELGEQMTTWNVSDRYGINVPNPALYVNRVAIRFLTMSRQVIAQIVANDWHGHVPKNEARVDPIGAIETIIWLLMIDQGVSHQQDIYPTSLVDRKRYPQICHHSSLVDRERYPQLCQKINQTLGSDILESIATGALLESESPSQLAAVKQYTARTRELAAAAREVLDSSPHHGFVAWPIIQL